MNNVLDEKSENHPNRVRRNTRPYVGVIDWFDTVNTDPFSGPVQYYGSIEIDGYFRPGILWRYRNEGGLHYQEHWSPRTKTWEATLHLTKMIIGGECSLADMTPDQAMDLIPEAFQDAMKVDDVS